MTGINRKNESLWVSLSLATKCQFRSKMLISQLLRSEFCSCEIDVTVLRSGTRVPKPLSQLRNTLRNGTLVRNHAFPLHNAFRSCEMDATVLRSGTRVPNSLSQLRNTFAETSTVLRNGLATKFSFRRSFLQSAKFRRALFFPCFCSVSAPISARFFFLFNFLEISSTWDHLKRLKHT